MFAWLTGNETTPPAFLEVRSSKWLIITTVSAAVFTDIFLYGIIVPVLPFALSSRAGVAQDSVQTWISVLLAVYGGALLVGAPISGWAADIMSSRRWSFLFGLVVLAGSTVLLTVGNSLGIIIAGRVLQGLSAAVVWVVGLALLSDTVGPAEIGQAMGWVGMAMSLAFLLAPLLGGIVFDRYVFFHPPERGVLDTHWYYSAGYYAVFAMAFGLLGADAVLRLIMIEKKVALKWLGPEAAEVVAEHRKSSSDEPKSDSRTLEQEEKPKVARKGRNLPPIITLLSSYRLDAALFGCLIQAALLTSFDSILPLYVRQIWGWDSIGAGLIFLPITIPTFVSPVVGWASDKYGPRWLATAGFVIAGPCMILLRLVDHNDMGQKVLLCALLAVIGLALVLALTPLMAEITYAVEARAAKRPAGFYGPSGAMAQAYGLFNMAFAGGSMAGPLLAGLVKDYAGWGTTTLVLGCVSLVSCVPCVVWSGGSIFKQRRKRKSDADAEAEAERAAVDNP